MNHKIYINSDLTFKSHAQKNKILSIPKKFLL